MLVAGADAGSVEAAIKRSGNGNSELATSRKFQEAERAVPTARQAFAYLDPALIYARVDAALRPVLFMSAAFLPGIAETVDLNKLPAAEIITRHLSPIVMSQSYDRDGYIAESVGPVTLYQTIIGLGGLGGAAVMLYQSQTRGWASLQWRHCLRLRRRRAQPLPVRINPRVKWPVGVALRGRPEHCEVVGLSRA